ncbi:uncharacterized protein LOC118445986 isoform X3 [Vespa mandarinia]|uniref:uncharacterized protein LOC118445986 isoform X3 n=1 Tax=Vespa mandarinia TaxID=7446 RepID=UPI0016119733|nr:uncharacterized protein LOC118445986 isoform X3 [Vespa mandarinia]
MIISDDVDNPVDNKYVMTIERTLKILWLRRQILNVLIFLPFAKNGPNLMYAYDPFFLNKNDERGKLESINVVSKEDIFQRLSTLNHRRTNNMYGYKLNVGLFQQYQTLMKMRDKPSPGSIYKYSAGYNGSDAIILGTIAKYMNFTVNEINPRDQIKFGYELSNGTYVGTLERILLSTLSITNITMAGLFGGLLYKSFSNDMYYKDIDLLTELDASELPIVFIKYNLNDVFDDESATSLVLNNLRRKLKHGVQAVRDVTYFRNASGLIRKKHYYLLKNSIVNDDLSPKLHLVKECPRNYYLAYPIPRNSYLLEKFNLLIGRLNQGGLLTLWSNRTIMNLINRRRGTPKRQAHAGDKFVPFNLEDMQTSFYLLIIGLLISSIVFCDEKGWLRRHVKKRRKKIYPNEEDTSKGEK